MKLIDRRKFLNITRIYKDDPSDVVFRKYAVRQLIKAQPVVNAIPIPEGATNGDVIKAMFPLAEVKEKNNGYEVYFGIGTATQYFNYQWWNAPYNSTQNLQDADKSGLEYADQPTLTSAT